MKEKLMIEALERIGFRSDDYFNITKSFTPELFATYAHMLYALGFDEGIKFERKKHANNMQKPVVQIDMYGNQIAQYDSCTDAGRSVDRAKNSIAGAANLGRKCAGYYWKFIK